MIQRTECAPPLPATSFSFTILVDSPIRRNLPFCPVSAMLFPIASTEIEYASMIVAGIDVLMTFLFKRSLAHPPNFSRPTPEHYPVTLTLPQLTQLMQATMNGQIPMQPLPQPVPGQGFGPVGTDEPLFPDNLSVSLVISAPFAPFDGSPDTSFNVPLFEIPGVPGNLIIALGIIIAQFFIERSGIGIPNGNGGDSVATF
ncbi:hypothetical protein DEAC_c37780 [Desulfosporosinus acididurans]|uniref:Uncharacterized protein n=1 Tax=Desulfosporosinus acididurans TaxID=476652 RepID=A0A0J1FLE7_9FIRM|nr:hypothetical protein [Desulfosporosinus acididurans]KLU64344.1 hypothetical protein DEAC_c37780 [Desulfosporosinus acididurans]